MTRHRVPCPEKGCDGMIELRITKVTPGLPATRLSPPEGPEIEWVVKDQDCDHDVEDHDFYEALVELEQEAYYDLQDQHDDYRYRSGGGL